MDDLWNTLLRFHREIVVPDIDSRIGTVNTRIDGLAGDMLSHFDAIYMRLDTLGSEYHSLNAAVRRIEEGRSR